MDVDKSNVLNPVMKPIFPQSNQSQCNIYDCFKKPPERRSQIEVMNAIKQMEQFLFYKDFLSKLPPKQLFPLFHIIRYEHFQPNQIIYQSQQIANKFYIILEGQIRAYLPNSQLFNEYQDQPQQSLQEDDIFVKTYGKGDYFGESELFYNTNRIATAITCEQGVHLGYIISQQFHKYFDALLKNISPFIGNSPLAQIIPKLTRVELSYRLENINLLHDEFIYQQGEQSNKVYFIKEGEIEIYHNLDHASSPEQEHNNQNGNGSRKREVLIPPENFGEENLLALEPVRTNSAVCSSVQAKIQGLDINILKQRLFENFGQERAIEIIQMYLINKEKSHIEYNLATEKIKDKLRQKRELNQQQVKFQQNFADKYNNYFNQQYFDKYKSKTPSPGKHSLKVGVTCELDTNFLKVQNIELQENPSLVFPSKQISSQQTTTITHSENEGIQPSSLVQYYQNHTIDVNDHSQLVGNNNNSPSAINYIRIQKRDIVNKSIQVKERSEVIQENQQQVRVKTAELRNNQRRKINQTFEKQPTNFINTFEKSYIATNKNFKPFSNFKPTICIDNSRQRLQTLPVEESEYALYKQNQEEDDKENQCCSPNKMAKQNSKNKLIKQLLNSANKMGQLRQMGKVYNYEQGFSVVGQRMSSKRPKPGMVDNSAIVQLKQTANVNEKLQLNAFEELLGENFNYALKINGLTNKMAQMYTKKNNSYVIQNKQQRIFENIVHQYFTKQQKSLQKNIHFNQDQFNQFNNNNNNNINNDNNSNNNSSFSNFQTTNSNFYQVNRKGIYSRVFQSITPKLKKRNKNYLSKSPYHQNRESAQKYYMRSANENHSIQNFATIDPQNSSFHA